MEDLETLYEGILQADRRLYPERQTLDLKFNMIIGRIQTLHHLTQTSPNINTTLLYKSLSDIDQILMSTHKKLI